MKSVESTFVTLENLERRRHLSATQTNLVSDGAVSATTIDANLVNPWGLAIGPSGVLWTSNAGKNNSTAYTGSGQTLSDVVAIPAPASGGSSLPTGVIANNDPGFAVTANGTTGDSLFVYATIRGTIAGWSPAVNATSAVTAVDRSASGASYTGLAVAGAGAHRRLYAADFHGGKIDVFDTTFASASTAGGFNDPNLPAGYSPFNVQAVEGKLYVMYAKKDPNTGRDAPGVGNGVVDVFGKGGRLQERLATAGTLDAPWGVAVAPATWNTPLANKILIGNFGDGEISVFNRKGKILGQLEDHNSQPIVIQDLWSLTRGSTGTSDADTLFFTAGINAEADGLLGTLSA